MFPMSSMSMALSINLNNEPAGVSSSGMLTRGSGPAGRRLVTSSMRLAPGRVISVSAVGRRAPGAARASLARRRALPAARGGLAAWRVGSAAARGPGLFDCSRLLVCQSHSCHAVAPPRRSRSSVRPAGPSVRVRVVACPHPDPDALRPWPPPPGNAASASSLCSSGSARPPAPTPSPALAAPQPASDLTLAPRHRPRPRPRYRLQTT